MIDTYSFGEWMKQRRKTLRRTQRELAATVHCSIATIKKIEADERHPSLDLAQALAAALDIPTDQHSIFVKCARREVPVDQLVNPPPLATASPPFTPPLPQPTTPFIGRQAELADIADKLSQPNCRLLTLLGPGGMGKTRLALESARSVQGGFADGALFVPLASVTDVSEIPRTIAQALHMPLTGNDLPALQIQRLLRRRHLLLLLDNFEQLVSGADLLSELLAAAPKLKILVTSRERLNLLEEWLYPVPALAEAVALFAGTAIRVKPDFDLEAEETAVTQICHLVAGHPLAVELAASWSRFMPTQKIAEKIEQDLNFLTSSARNLPERHSSIQALFDQSWALLTSSEQTALAKLTVFRGSFAPEEGEAVAGATWPILLGLVDKSLVEAQGDNRFDLHPLIQQYAATKLVEAADEEATRQLHFEAFCALAQQLNDSSIGPRAIISSQKTEREHNNFRAALRWGLANQQSEAVLKLLHNIFVFWLPAGHWQEGEQWSAKAVDQAKMDGQDSVNLSLALCQLGIFIAVQGRYPEAVSPAQRSYQMAQRLEDPWTLVHTLQLQGQSRPDKEGALAAFAEGVAICREQVGEPQFEAYLCSLLWLQGDRLMNFGLMSEAKIKFSESLARFRQLKDAHQISYPLGNLGRIALHEGDLQKAYDLINESAAIARTVGDRVSIGDWLFRLGQTLLYLGDLDGAEVNLQEAMQIYEEVGNQSGAPDVLSCLALVALERKNEALARNQIQESMTLYSDLQEAMKQVDPAATIIHFRDTPESLLHVGVVACALQDWANAVALFRFVEKNTQGYTAIQPLQEKVAAAEADIKVQLSSVAYAAAVSKGEELTVDELPALWLE